MVKLNHYMTIKEAASFLGVSPMTLRRWDNEKKLRAIRHPMNNYRLYERKQLEKILKETATGKKGTGKAPR
ncbi:MerR family DNA-binding transcriptional regulator [bacterium]|nr:MerR family DNA-binding transcriptional regulator [bacterium]NIN91425.1 MerR family DNA-binding transcriptional regulator [bacterium]NIO17835.1 MerR family DNA-binding transcriptional regulator [bacterium]NIO72816.1 MerR family DNA-binding transcriptional regulator [bacterium]